MYKFHFIAKKFPYLSLYKYKIKDKMHIGAELNLSKKIAVRDYLTAINYL